MLNSSRAVDFYSINELLRIGIKWLSLIRLNAVCAFEDTFIEEWRDWEQSKRVCRVGWSKFHESF